MRYLAVVIIALLSPVLTDVFTMLWLTLSASWFDAADAHWLGVAVPVIADVLILQALVLWTVYRRDPWRIGALYLAVFCFAQALYLTSFHYPLGDIARYLLIIVMLGVVVIALFRRFAWRPA